MKQAWKKGMGVLMISALAMGSLTGCSGGSNATGGPGGNMPGMEAEASAAATLTVRIEQPQYGSIFLDSELVGTVQPKTSAEVFPKMSGTVNSVHFAVGDTVSQGQVLATVDSDSLISAQINIETAQLQLETAEKSLERTQVLYDNDGATLQTLESAQSSVRSAQLQLESAQDNYHNLLNNVNIIAPISGVVESKNIKVYDTASMQSSICVISQKDTMQVVFQVSERVKNSLALGDAIAITKNSSSYDGTITEISSKTEENTGLFEVKANIHQAESLSTGSRVAVQLTTDKAENVLMIPLGAIYYDNGSPYVFISNNGIAEIVYIETGIYDSDYIEVISGLTESTQVITSWSSQLVNGAAVQAAN